MKISIRKKINIILFMSMFAVGFSIGIIFYIQYSNYMMKSVEDKLFNGLFSISNIVDLDSLPKLKPESRYEKTYSDSWKKVKNIQKNLGLAYIYIILMGKDHKFYFTYDTGTNPDPNINEQGEDDNFLMEYKNSPKEAHQAFEKKKLIVSKEPYTDQWGTFISAFYPIELNGKVIGVIGSDYKINDILALQRKAKLILFSILMIGVVIVIIAGSIIRKFIVVPIIKLNEGSSEIAKGNLDFSIDIKQKDEIGELANSFNTMAQNLKSSFQTIQEYNEQLEEKVANRTKELQDTLVKVQELKTQQDGDYFLTTLIANPLMQNRNKSEKVKIEFFLEQKKKFQFKGKTHALGGDLNISGNLNFRGSKYTVFFNGDAMGKSMQGAGGALVIGSVLNSIMARSASNKKILDCTPNEWISETFTEVQRVMESFDGAMLVSCILGLIEDSTGKMIYFNAEHPFSVLYRDGKASFIESEISAHKMGMPFNTHVEYYDFQLRPGDVIICGSDGKDDIVFEILSDMQRVINEDEKLFLAVVENGKGVLKDMHALLQKSGEFSDDLSLLRISFLENNTAEETERFLNTPAIEKDIIGDLIKEKKYSHALEELEKIEDESNLNFIYRKSLCLNKLKRNHEALKLLSNVNTKIKEHTQVIKLLAKLYFDMGNFKESESYLQKLNLLFPNDEEIQKSLSRVRSLLS
jgi:HAMP domain-containing protein